MAELDRPLKERQGGLARQEFVETSFWKRQETHMDLLAERGRRVSVDELNTTRLLAHARKQAVQRKFDDILI
ncbi:MAG TPA: hypothetical protein VF237_05135, partial [Xanthobacteraceae bacterium]